MIIPSFMFDDRFDEFQSVIQNHGGIRTSIAKGKILDDANSPVHTSYFIISGIAKLVMTNEEGRENLLFFFSKGSMYPLSTLDDMLTMENYLSLVAVTDLEVLAFPANNIYSMLAESEKFQKLALKHYIMYANTLLCKILLSSYNDSTISVASYIYLMLSNSKTRESGLQLTQEDMGNMLGLSRTQTARSLAILRSEGLVRTSRAHIEVINMEKLKDYCSPIVYSEQ